MIIVDGLQSFRELFATVLLIDQDVVFFDKTITNLLI